MNATKQKIAPCQASRKDAHMLLSGSEKQSAKKKPYGEDGRRTHQDMMPSGFSMQARNQGGCATEC